MGNLLKRLRDIVTAYKRAIPGFIIIGAQKSGTTSLYSYLGQHPDFIPSYKKEVHYFDTYYHRGFLWYKSHFPYKKQLNNDKITGEASPSYICHPRTPQRIYEKIPDVKLIVLLRNPVDRAISSYMHQKRAGREQLSVMKAFEKEEERTKNSFKKLQENSGNVKKSSKQYRRYTYLERGKYIKQLKKYFKYFSREQIYIKCAEHFFADPRKTVREVFTFLGIDPGFTPENMDPINVTNYEKYPDINDQVYDFLEDYYRSYNQELFKYLRVHYPW
ncbi:MAG: sulfotransferase domain-containing protein [Elusimicrobiota bacterium]